MTGLRDQPQHAVRGRSLFGLVVLGILLLLVTPSSADEVQQAASSGCDDLLVEPMPDGTFTATLPPQIAGLSLPKTAFTVERDGITVQPEVRRLGPDELSVVVVLASSVNTQQQEWAQAKSVAIETLRAVPDGALASLVIASDRDPVVAGPTRERAPLSSALAAADLKTAVAAQPAVDVALRQVDQVSRARVVLIADATAVGEVTLPQDGSVRVDQLVYGAVPAPATAAAAGCTTGASGPALLNASDAIGRRLEGEYQVRVPPLKGVGSTVLTVRTAGASYSTTLPAPQPELPAPAVALPPLDDPPPPVLVPGAVALVLLVLIAVGLWRSQPATVPLPGLVRRSAGPVIAFISRRASAPSRSPDLLRPPLARSPVSAPASSMDGAAPGDGVRPASLLEIAGVLSTAGLAVVFPLQPRLAGAGAVGLVLVAVARRYGVRATLLHLLVLSMFVESVTLGPARVGRVLAVVVPVYMLLRMALQGWRPPPIAADAWLPGLAFLGWAAASGYWSSSTDGWLSAMGALALAASYFVAFAFLPASRQEVRYLLRTFVVAATCVTGLALYQASLGERAVGLQGDPNIFSLYQGAAISASLVLARTERTAGARWAWRLTVIPLVVSVLVSQSRGGLLVLLAVVAFSMGSRGGLPRSSQRALVVLAVLGLVAVVPLFADRVAPRLTLSAVAETRGSGRLDIWRAAGQAWERQPLLGLGGGNFQPESQQLLQTTPGVQLDPESPLIVTGIRVHNVYLETLTEYGPLGLGLWLSILITTAAGLRRTAARVLAKAPEYAALVPMLVAFCAGTVFISATNSKLLWLLVGLHASAGRLQPQSVRLREGLEDLVLPQSTNSSDAEHPDAGGGWRRGRLRRHAHVLLPAILALVFAGLAAGITLLQPTQYRSSVVLLVPPGAVRVDNETVVRTLQALVTTSPVAQDVATRAGLSLSAGQVQDRLAVERPPDSSLLQVAATDTDRTRSQKLADAVGPALDARLVGVQQAAPAQNAELRALTVLPVTTQAQTVTVRPPVSRNTVLGLVLGGLVGLAVVAFSSSLRSQGSEQGRVPRQAVEGDVVSRSAVEERVS